MRAPRPAAPDRSVLVVTKLSDLSPAPLSWLWPRRIPLGMVTLLAGDGGRGKSTLMLDIAARVTTGRPMPDEEKSWAPRGVIIFSAEDHLQSVVVPRLDLAGANRRLVSALRTETPQGDARELMIEPRDLDLVEEYVSKASVSLVVFDPMVAFVGADTNLHHNQDARRVLARLHGLAERTGCAVVGIHHFNRALHQDAVHRLTGSAGMGNASRSVLVVGPDPDDEGRLVLALAKHNLAPRGTPSLAYRLVGSPGSDHPTVEWCGEVAASANDLVAIPRDPEERGKLADARQYLREALASGWVPQRELQRDAPCSERTLREAKRQERVVARRVNGHWLWGLLQGEPDPSTIPTMQSCRVEIAPLGANNLGQGCNAAIGGGGNESAQATEARSINPIERAEPVKSKPGGPTGDDTCSRCGAALSAEDPGFLCSSCVRVSS